MKPQTQTALESLLLDPSGPSVVAIGGGHGQAAALEAIQTYAGAISALVTVADDGGSSGRLSELGIPPPGDVRRCLLALTPDPSLWSELFAHRFSAGDISDHSLGNLILAALANIFGDFTTAVDTAARMLGALGEVVPVADEPVTLNFVNADIEAVAAAVGKMTNRNFLIDPRVRGTINIVSARPVPSSAVYGIFLSALRLQGFTAVEAATSPRSCRKRTPSSTAGPRW